MVLAAFLFGIMVGVLYVRHEQARARRSRRGTMVITSRDLPENFARSGSLQ